MKRETEWVRKSPMYIQKKDDRYETAKEQLKTRGFTDSETWGLDYSIVEFVIPRLKRFKQVNNGYPPELTAESWDKILDEMIEGFEVYSEDYLGDNSAKVEKACAHFSKWWRHLWW